MTKIHRNDMCPCGSGKKYKKCCALKETQQKQRRFEGLKGLKEQAKLSSGAASPITNKVFSVLSSTMTSSQAQSTVQSHKENPHGDSCECSEKEEAIARQEEDRAQARGYRTLEELIGIEPEQKMEP